MSARTVTRNARRRRRTITYLWIVVLAAVTISLIYWEQTAILYILATLGVTVLLVVVAMSDLGRAEKFSTEALAPNQAARVGSGAGGVTQTFGKKPTSGGKQRT
jgi:hypothetical protein